MHSALGCLRGSRRGASVRSSTQRLCSAQTFVPYGSPYMLPIPQDARPSAVTTATSVNYPDVSSGGLMTLANATTDFALRLGEYHPMNAESLDVSHGLPA